MSSSEEKFGEIPWRIKEDAGFPINYYQLSYEQQVFVDHLLDKVVEMGDTIEKLEKTNEEFEETIEDLEVKLEELTGE